MQKRFFDANVLSPRSVLHDMNERSHSPHGKINLHGNGLGVPSPEMVEKRAREIAMIDERNPDEFTETDWHQAKNELTGVEGSHAPEVGDDMDDETKRTRRSDRALPVIARRTTVRGRRIIVGEELVSGGIEEAAHDQMVEARREELEHERESVMSSESVIEPWRPPRESIAPGRNQARVEHLLARFQQVRKFSEIAAARRSNRRIASCSRCPTSARRNGTSRTRVGFSRPSS